MMPAFSSSFFTRLAQAILIFGFLSRAIQAEDTDVPDSDPPADLVVSDVFVVKSGTEKGGCDDHDVNQWYQDAVTLARAAQEVLADAVAANANGDTSAESLKYLQTFFDIRPLKRTPLEFTTRTDKMTGKFPDT
jgi:hypothetical protein